jgi:hypothetical protein
MILHKALLLGQIMFATVCIFLVYNKTRGAANEELDRILQVVALALAAGGFFAGTSLFKKKLLQIRDMQTDTKEKLSVYRSACITQWALIEGPSLFTIICFFLTGNYAFIALTAILILLFTVMAPSKAKIAFHLGLTEAEMEDL